jgi:hypothetical protein
MTSLEDSHCCSKLSMWDSQQDGEDLANKRFSGTCSMSSPRWKKEACTYSISTECEMLETVTMETREAIVRVVQETKSFQVIVIATTSMNSQILSDISQSHPTAEFQISNPLPNKFLLHGCLYLCLLVSIYFFV